MKYYLLPANFEVSYDLVKAVSEKKPFLDLYLQMEKVITKIRNMQGVFSLRFIPMSSYCKGILGTQSSNNM
jgi:hypothetical protein